MQSWTFMLLGFISYFHFPQRIDRRSRALCNGHRNVETPVQSKGPGLELFGYRPQPHPPVRWIIRPATVHDRVGCAALLNASYHALLRADYTSECLAQCLPVITQPREQLLTCQTWYLAEHPSTRQIVGCGGWTLRRRQPTNTTNTLSATHATEPTIQSNKEVLVDAGPADGTPPRVEVANSNSEQPKQQNPPASPSIPQLRHFAVHPDYVRLGIASALWERTQADIQTQYSSDNLTFPELYVFSTRTGVSFYASLGFVVIQTADFQLTKDGVFPTVLMRRYPTT